MVHFIHGGINSGKTTKLMETYDAYGGEGFVMIKQMRDGMVYGYAARQLSTGEERQLVIRDTWKPEDFDGVCSIGPYSFSAKALGWIEETLGFAIEQGIDNIYLDEVGDLELQGQGFHNILKDLLVSEAHLYLTIRDNMLQPVVEYFGIEDYETTVYTGGNHSV